MASGEDLTHEEVWDDSALLDSWNEAVEEYKHYHSLHARGEKVEQVLRQVDEEGLEAVVMKQTDSDVNVEGQSTGVISASAAYQGHDTAQADFTEAEPRFDNGMAGMPQAVLPPGQDDGMRNLMMSWYYAGYYTGLHEGRQQAIQEASSSKPGAPS